MANPASKYTPRIVVAEPAARSRAEVSAGDSSSGSSDSIDLAELGAALRQNYKLIAVITALTFIAVAGVTLASPMDFTSSGRLYLGESNDRRMSHEAVGSELDLSGSGAGDIASEMEILKSRSLVKRAILESGLNVALMPAGTRRARYWEWLLSGRDSALLDVGNHDLLPVHTSLREGAQRAERFRIRFTTGAQYEVYSGQRLLGSARLGEAAQLDGLKLTLRKAGERTPAPGAEYDATIEPLDKVVDASLRALELDAPRAGTSSELVRVVTLTFTSTSPRQGALFLERLMHGYLDERQSWKTEDATAAEAFVSHQLQGMRNSLDDVEQRLANYRTENHVVVLDSEADSMIAQIAKYEEQRVAARLEVAALADVKRGLSDPNTSIEAYMLGEARDTVLEGLAASLASSRRDLAELSTRFKAAAPEMKEQQAQVEAQLSAIKNYVSNRLSRAKEHLATLNGIIAQFEQKLRTVPGAKTRLSQLARESEVYSELYSYLLEQQQQAAIVKASRVSKNRILDHPQVQYRETSPNLAVAVIGGPVGVLLGIGVVLLTTFFGSTFQSEQAVRKSVSGLPIFAHVPKRKNSWWRRTSSRAAAETFPIAPEFIEVFRTLRTKLYLADPEGRNRVVLFTSPSPGDGKTTCAHALASMLAADGKRVLLIDANLEDKKPAREGERPHGDLVAALRNPEQWRGEAHAVTGEVGEFYVLGVGEPMSAELLFSNDLLHLIEHARADNHFVLIDAASFPRTSDALVLSRFSDCILTVIRLRNTRQKSAREHLRALVVPGRTHAIIVNESNSSCAAVRWATISRPAQRRSSTPKPALLSLAWIRNLLA